MADAGIATEIQVDIKSSDQKQAITPEGQNNLEVLGDVPYELVPLPWQTNESKDTTTWKRNVRRLIRRKIISSISGSETLSSLTSDVKKKEGELGVDNMIDSLVSKDLNVDPKMAKAATFLSSKLREEFPAVKAVVLLGSSVHGGAVIREATGTPGEPDMDWAIITEGIISEEEAGKITDYAGKFRDQIAEDSDLGEEFHLCITANPKQYRAINLEDPQQVFKDILRTPRHPNRGKRPKAEELGQYRSAILYLQPSFPSSVNESNVQVILEGLKLVSAEDPGKWRLAVDEIMKAWRFSHKLKSKHFNTAGKKTDMNLLRRVVEKNSSKIMSSALYSLLKSTGNGY